MSETVENQPEPDFECETCGHNGFYGDQCQTCNRPITQKRQYTLSEIRAGKAPDDGERYSRTGFVGPKIVNIPGSGGPGGDTKNN